MLERRAPGDVLVALFSSVHKNKPEVRLVLCRRAQPKKRLQKTFSYTRHGLEAVLRKVEFAKLYINVTGETYAHWDCRANACKEPPLTTAALARPPLLPSLRTPHLFFAFDRLRCKLVVVAEGCPVAPRAEASPCVPGRALPTTRFLCPAASATSPRALHRAALAETRAVLCRKLRPRVLALKKPR